MIQAVIRGCARWAFGRRGDIGFFVSLLLFVAAAPFGVLSLSSLAAAQTAVLDRLFVEGNQRIEAATVESYMTIRPGEQITAGRVDLSLKALFATGLFSDVTIRRAGNNLVVSVIENPIINRLAFEGNLIIDDDVLAAEVQLRPRVVFTSSRVQNDLQRLIEVYRRSGRFAATVEPKVIQLPQNRVDLIFEISEGDVTGVRKINVIGNRAFSDRKLRSELSTKETKFWRPFSSADNYDPDRLTFDRELLRRFYLKNGYADFRVISAVAELAADRSDFFIIFSVEEGERFKIGSIAVDSNIRSISSEFLESFIEIEEGDRYNAEKVEETIQELTFVIGNAGFAFVDAIPRATLDRENNLVHLVFEVDEGPRVYVERINITGNVRTLDKVIRREFRVTEGDAFNAARLRESRRQIRGLAYFSTVELSNEPGSAEDKTVVNVAVQEQSTGDLTFGIGFSTVDSAVADVTIQERNLLGKGQDLSLSFQISARSQQIDLSFTEPYFLDRNLAAGFDVFRTSSNRQSESSFDSAHVGFALRAGYGVTQNLRHSVRYLIQSETISDVGSDASQFIIDQTGTSVTSAIGQSLSYDVRNDTLRPTDGFIIRFDQTLAGLGGSKQYLKNELNYAFYYPVADDWIAIARLREGYIVGIGQDVGITDRFFLGGSSFKWFQPGGLGPRDTSSGDALGGNLLYVGTTELLFPLGFPRELGVLGRVFSQFGSLAQVDETGDNLFDVGSLRMSAGFGISWISPFGPIEIDYATVLKKEAIDETQSLFVSFGTRF